MTATKPPREPDRRKLPDERRSITHKFVIYGRGYDGLPKEYDGYLTVGLYDDGSPGEIFVRFAKMGARQGALLDAWCVMVSIALQYGIALDKIIDKFRGWGFEPQGLTGNKAIHTCTSPMDYIVKWLDIRFCNDEREQ